jgi:hypothetical protein
MISEHYLIEWGHTYMMHFGAWVSFAFGAQVTKKGLPEPKEVKSLLVSAIVMAAVVAVFSSHSHNHFLQHFSSK